MLRIAIAQDSSDGASFGLEGALVGAWVEELRRVCEPALGGGAALSLDLSRVSFVSREGVQLLAGLRGRGAVLLNCSPLVVEQLKAHATA